MKLYGVSALDRTLARAQGALREPAQRRVIANAAQIVVDRAKVLAPVKTGYLRDSIGMSFHPPREMSFSIQDNGVRVYIGPSAEVAYAPYVEFGTWKHAGHPFMRPALDQTRDEVQSALAHGLWGTIRAAISR